MVAILLFTPDYQLTTAEFPAASSREAKARDLTLVCPGAIRGSGGTSGTELGKFTELGAATENLHFNNQVGVNLEIRDGSYTAIDPKGLSRQSSNLLAVNQLQLLTEKTITGLAGATCQKPATDIWLIGGDTSLGNETILLLKNPSSVDSTVELAVHTEAGELKAAGLSGISVSAEKSTALNLAALIPKTKTFAVRVQARGGAVAAWLQHRVTRGLETGGIDFVSPAQPASETQVMTGLFIRGSKDNSALIRSSDSYAALRPTLRVFNSADQPSTFTAQVLGANSQTFGTVIRQEVQARAVADFPIPSLVDGDYVVVVTADKPVQTAVRYSRTFKDRSPKTDFTWLSSLEKHTEPQTVALPSSGITKFSWYSPTDGRVLTRELPAGGKYQFTENAGGYYASLVVDINGQLSVLPVANYRNAGGIVSISLR